MRLVVSDTSPIRALHHLGYVDVLAILFERVLIPPAVASELAEPRRPRFAAIRAADYPFLHIETPRDRHQVARFRRHLDVGESEALALALEVSADAVLMDEKKGRSVAVQAGLRPVGALGILLRAKQRGIIGAVRPLIDRLEDELAFFIAPHIREEALKSAGE